MLTVARIAVFFRCGNELLLGYPSHIIGDFLGGGNLDALKLLNLSYEIRCVVERIDCSRIKPGIASAEELDIKVAVVEINLVYIGYFKLASPRGCQILGVFNNPVVLEIKACYSVIGFGLGRFFDY